MSDIWNRCVRLLENTLEQHDFERWVAPLRAKLNGNKLHIIAPNEHFADCLHANAHWEILKSTIDSASPQTLHIHLEAEEDIEENSISRLQARANHADVNERIKEAGLQPQFSFSNFVTGESNTMVSSIAKQIAENTQASIYNPFFIYGRSGLGKTHILYSIGNHMIRHTNTKVFYQHAPRFVSNFIASLNEKTMPQFKRFYRSFDVLLIDDVHFFAEKASTQEELFQIVNLMLEGHKQVVFTCDRYPKDLSGFSDRLRSRFGAGLAIELKPPELELRVAILKAKAREVSLDLPEEIAFLVAQKIRSNVRELQSALATLKAYHDFSGKPMTLLSTHEALDNVFASHSRAVSVDQIIKTVASYFRLRSTDLLGKVRRQPVVRARHMAMAMAKQLTNLSLSEIGDAFARDHTTVLHACRNVERLRKENTNFENDFNNLFITLSN